jgi:methionyl-tRNA formyltransferase
VTLHYIDEGIDTGPVIADVRFPIEWEDDAASVRGKLKGAGLRLLKEYWRAISSGTATRISQDESRARYYRLRTPEDGLIDWSRTSTEIYNLVRALVHPWPGAFTFLRGRKIVVRRVVPVKALAQGERRPGLVCHIEKSGLLRVVTGDGEVLISEAEVDAPCAGAVNLSETEMAEGDLLGV